MNKGNHSHFLYISIKEQLMKVELNSANINQSLERDSLSFNSHNDLNRKEIQNKRAVENLIKAGAMDTLKGNRRQKLIAYPALMDDAANEKKRSIAGQMSLFDLMGEDEADAVKLYSLPDAEDFPEELTLSNEKEVLGVYISGHPLQALEGVWKKNITKRTTELLRDEFGHITGVRDGATETIGGMIQDIVLRHTKKGDTMAILTIEDLVGAAEVIVWPDTYRKNKDILEVDQKVFCTGRVRIEDERDATIAANSIFLFSEVPVKLYVRFEDMESYEDNNKKLMSILNEALEGQDSVVVYIEKTRQQKTLRIKIAASEALDSLKEAFGDGNVVIL